MRQFFVNMFVLKYDIPIRFTRFTDVKLISLFVVESFKVFNAYFILVFFLFCVEGPRITRRLSGGLRNILFF